MQTRVSEAHVGRREPKDRNGKTWAARSIDVAWGEAMSDLPLDM
jgi:hypothetical protein